MFQCDKCNKDCIARKEPDPCKICAHNNRKERLKTCIGCGLSCKFEPKHKKQAKGRVCPLCQHAGDLQEHHLFRGIYRNTADQYGLTLYICGHCHNAIHSDPDKMHLLQLLGQVIFEQTHTRDEFRAEFGQSYIMRDDDQRAGQDVLDKMRRRQPIF